LRTSTGNKHNTQKTYSHARNHSLNALNESTVIEPTTPLSKPTDHQLSHKRQQQHSHKELGLENINTIYIHPHQHAIVDWQHSTEPQAHN
ncbi:MAG: hypothetical protein ACRCZI_02315, partial [Cetobacterium sp.]